MCISVPFLSFLCIPLRFVFSLEGIIQCVGRNKRRRQNGGHEKTTTGRVHTMTSPAADGACQPWSRRREVLSKGQSSVKPLTKPHMYVI